MKSKILTTIKWSFLVFSVVCLIIIVAGTSVKKMQRQKLKEQCTSSVYGICTNVTSESKQERVHKRRHSGSKSYKVTKTYTEYTSYITYTVDGKDYEITNVTDNRAYPEENNKIEIFYNPENPEIYYIP